MFSFFSLLWFLPIFINLNLIKNGDVFFGEQLFSRHCMSCHIGGTNIILPEKNLKKETLENLGINNQDSLVYQIINGKNGMPAFGGRLKEVEIKQITAYILKQSNNF